MLLFVIFVVGEFVMYMLSVLYVGLSSTSYCTMYAVLFVIILFAFIRVFCESIILIEYKKPGLVAPVDFISLFVIFRLLALVAYIVLVLVPVDSILLFVIVISEAVLIVIRLLVPRIVVSFSVLPVLVCVNVNDESVSIIFELLFIVRFLSIVMSLFSRFSVNVTLSPSFRFIVPVDVK